MAIKIIGDGWNVPSIESTQVLADFVYEIFSDFIGYELESDIIVENDLGQGYPLAHYEKKDGNWQITLSCASGTHWAQVAYQLAHEVCHLYCNHAQCRGHKHKWLEESFCECASIAVLDKLGFAWAASKMSRFNPYYGQSVLDYIADVKDSVIQKIDSHEDFILWLLANIQQLESSSTLRDLNRVVALYLYLSLLNETPNNWLSVTSLNKWDCFSCEDLSSFIESWLAASSDNLKETISVSKLLHA
ncbi:hypothetical protein AB4122_07540 [Vibrio cyclitrophicus]|uniref:hypothetical protein n=1 Tax=Vibrio cyclitrophicus TaxID=47951 RepID=UPI0002FC3F52|nr:hypothetical protein [Vibrio cyclitrophicus]OED76258.1 hypothetical protein OAS_00780 [Vibrio cyclitrophicus ZF65]PME16094.1 hypothetical protein BCV44_14980 [Vibrio cyclitrophicus]